MSRLLLLILLATLTYGGWRYYQSTLPLPRSSRTPVSVSAPTLSLNNPQGTFDALGAVLGESISTGVAAVNDTLSAVTSTQSEPLLNQAISNFQKELSTLPEDQVKKLQYNYCKSIVNEYEKNN